jgi:hypothetical protein
LADINASYASGVKVAISGFSASFSIGSDSSWSKSSLSISCGILLGCGLLGIACVI